MSFYLYLNFTLSQSLTLLLKETENVRCHTCQSELSLVIYNNEAVWLYTYKQSLTELQRLASLTLTIWATETTANHGQWLGVYMRVSGVETYASALLLSMSPHRCLHLLLVGLSINSTGYLSSSCFAWLLTQVCVPPRSVYCVCVCEGPHLSPALVSWWALTDALNDTWVAAHLFTRMFAWMSVFRLDHKQTRWCIELDISDRIHLQRWNCRMKAPLFFIRPDDFCDAKNADEIAESSHKNKIYAECHRIC